MTVSIPIIQWNAPVKDFQATEAAWAGSVDSVAWWLNLYGNAAVNERLQVATDSAIVLANETIEWTGGGALLSVRVIRSSQQDTPLEATAILDDGPMMLGLGYSSTEALFNYRGSDQMVSEPPSGWKFDETASYYIWVSKTAPKGVVLPNGSVRKLNDEVNAKFTELALNHFTEKYNTGQVLNNVVARAKEKLDDVAARDDLDSALRTVLESQKRVLAIQEDLQRALREAQQTANATMLFNTLRGVLSVVQLGQMVATELGQDSKQFDKATKIEDIWNTLDDRRVRIEERRVQLLSSFDGTTVDFEKYLAYLKTRLEDYVHPPASVTDRYLAPTVLPKP